MVEIEAIVSRLVNQDSKKPLLGHRDSKWFRNQGERPRLHGKREKRVQNFGRRQAMKVSVSGKLRAAGCFPESGYPRRVGCVQLNS